jgi:hypothetical protein
MELDLRLHVMFVRAVEKNAVFFAIASVGILLTSDGIAG